MAYPDLSVMRADDHVGFVWNSDPGRYTLPGHFLESGMAVAPYAEVESEFRRVIDGVVERISSCDNDPIARDLASDWQAVRDSLATERTLCSRLGMLGVNPYEDELPDELESALTSLDIDSMLIGDLLAASSVSTFKKNSEFTRAMLDKMAPSKSKGLRPRQRPPLAGRAYSVGFARAQWLREALDLASDEPVPDVEEVVEKALGSGFALCRAPGRDADIEAVVHSDGEVGAVVATRKDKQSMRFHTARVVHHALFATTDEKPTRLLTRSHDWQQSASRSFAAELLAPAAGLEARLGDSVDWGRDDAVLARAFDVAPYVIRHQLENHGLA